MPRRRAGVWRPLALVSTASLVGAAIAVALSQILDGLLGFVVAVILASVVTGILVWIFDRRFNLGLGSILRQTFPKIAGLISVAPGT